MMISLSASTGSDFSGACNVIIGFFNSKYSSKVNVVVINDVIIKSNGNLSGEKNTGSTEVDFHRPQVGSVHRTAVEN